MALKRFVLSLLFVSIFTWIIVAADIPPVHLIRQSGTTRINPIDEQLHRGMQWSHGAYVVEDNIAGQPPVFYTLNRDGDWITTARFQNPEATLFYTFTYDRETDGTIVFSGQTETAPRVVSPFLAWTSADGKIQRMLRTDHYFPYALAVAPDDTIWTLGYEMVNLDPEDPAVNKDAHVLRHFDKSGNLIGSAFPQSQFDRHQRSRLTHALLAATRDRLGWYGTQSGTAAYTEISFDTMTRKEYPGAPSSAKYSMAVGFAIAENGATSVSVQDGSPGARTNYVLDRASSQWVPVNVPPMGGFKFTPILIGSDGDQLVFKYGRESGFFNVSQ